MDVQEAIRCRRSVREYQPRAVEEEKLARLIEAARLAPSARNLQEWKFVIVRRRETRLKLAALAAQPFIGTAPVVIAACAVETKLVMRCGQLAYPIDVAIALDHLALAAVEEGLGSCWIGAFDEEKVKALLGVPAEVRIVELLTLGYPEEPLKPRRKSRKPLDEIVVREKWE